MVDTSIFDIRSAHYDRLDWVNDAAFATKIVAMTMPEPDDILLDVATGTGAIPHFLVGKVARIYGIDPSEKMLGEAARRLRACSSVVFVRADGQRLPFADGLLDLVVCRNGLHHFEDPDVGLAESFRVLKEGGAYILIEPVAPSLEAKPIWSDLFRARDKGRHPDFYFTSDELCRFVSHSCRTEVSAIDHHVVSLPMNQWLDTGCISDAEAEGLLSLLRGLDSTSLNALGVYPTGEEFAMDHVWALLRLRKGERRAI